MQFYLHGIDYTKFNRLKKGSEHCKCPGIVDTDYYDNPDNEGYIMELLRNRKEFSFKKTEKKGGW